MRTDSIENAKTKSKKSKTHPKSRAKINIDEMDDPEAQLMSPIDRMKKGHLATTPVTPAGNIVDMQGFRNQTPDNVSKDKPGLQVKYTRGENSDNISDFINSIADVTIKGRDCDSIFTKDCKGNNPISMERTPEQIKKFQYNVNSISDMENSKEPNKTVSPGEN